MHRLLGIFLSQDGDNARIVCARRSANGKDSEVESLSTAKAYLESGRVALIDISRSEMSLSSSALRAQCRNGHQSWTTATTPEIRQYIVDHKLYHSI